MIQEHGKGAGKGGLPPSAKAAIELRWTPDCGEEDRAAAARAFDLAMQRGVRMWLPVGVSVAETLQGSLGLSDAQLDAVQTVFLDSSPVDDLGAAIVRDGATLALSASLPGLVGAVMRRGGDYSKLRESITSHAEVGEPVEQGYGVVTIKVFNVLLREIAPNILSRGVLLPARELHALLTDAPDALWGCIGEFKVNGVSVDMDSEELSFPASDVPVLFRLE